MISRSWLRNGAEASCLILPQENATSAKKTSGSPILCGPGVLWKALCNRLKALRVLLLVPCLLLTGCAALAPFGSLLSGPSGGPPPLQVHEQTSVELKEGNFALIKTNVMGQSKGFSLLGFITIYPATLTKAMSRLYAAAQMSQGDPQTVAHLIIEQTSSYYILFGIPRVDVRADIVEFKPELDRPRPPPRRPPPNSER